MSVDLSTAAVPIDQQTQSEPKNNDLLKAHQNYFITANEKTIKETLDAAKLTDAQANEVLINHLANAYFYNKMLEINNAIFEEQIKILAHLNSLKIGCPQFELFQFYQDWLNKGNTPNYNFDNFLGFMLKVGLINQNMDGYWIAPLGVEFLTYCIRCGKKIN